MVEEAFVRAHSLGLDWFKQVFAIVGERTHQEVFLVTKTTQQQQKKYHLYYILSVNRHDPQLTGGSVM